MDVSYAIIGDAPVVIEALNWGDRTICAKIANICNIYIYCKVIK